MKHAISDLNMTVVIVIAVAGLVAFFGGVIWPSIRSNIDKEANCSDAICYNCSVSTGTCDCDREMKDGSVTQFKCPYKG